jgi:hypothetical protein
MSNWTARLKSEILKMGLGATDITDETPLLSVLAVPPGAIYKFPDRLSSVSSVGVWAVFENTQLASDLIEAAMRRCDEFNDSESDRQQMRDDCMALSPELQRDLLDHFNHKPTNF